MHSQVLNSRTFLQPLIPALCLSALPLRTRPRRMTLRDITTGNACAVRMRIKNKHGSPLSTYTCNHTIDFWLAYFLVMC